MHATQAEAAAAAAAEGKSANDFHRFHWPPKSSFKSPPRSKEFGTKFARRPQEWPKKKTRRHVNRLELTQTLAKLTEVASW